MKIFFLIECYPVISFLRESGYTAFPGAVFAAMIFMRPELYTVFIRTWYPPRIPAATLWVPCP